MPSKWGRVSPLLRPGSNREARHLPLFVGAQHLSRPCRDAAPQSRLCAAPVPVGSRALNYATNLFSSRASGAWRGRACSARPSPQTRTPNVIPSRFAPARRSACGCEESLLPLRRPDDVSYKAPRPRRTHRPMRKRVEFALNPVGARFTVPALRSLRAQ